MPFLVLIFVECALAGVTQAGQARGIPVLGSHWGTALKEVCADWGVEWVQLRCVAILSPWKQQ